MQQTNFHNKNFDTFTNRSNQLSIIPKLISYYKMWHEFKPTLPKTSRYTLGAKIDYLFIATVEAIFMASYLPGKEKIPLLNRASAKLDLLKFFLQIMWEIKSIDNKKYIAISQILDEVGKMLGGWQKHFTKETAA